MTPPAPVRHASPSQAQHHRLRRADVRLPLLSKGLKRPGGDVLAGVASWTCDLAGRLAGLQGQVGVTARTEEVPT